MAVLGRPAAEFERYEAQIREEYSWVPEATFRVERARILAAFLRRTALFGSATFRERYQARARLNLQRSLARLSATP